MASAATSHDTYKRVDVETASQGKLIVMLLNGAVQRSEEAKRHLAKGNAALVHKNLIRAQDIIGELRGALNMKAGEIATNLDRIYEYFQHLLVKANIRKEPNPIDECIELMIHLRDTWRELFDTIAKEEPPQDAPRINTHGSTVMNLQG